MKKLKFLNRRSIGTGLRSIGLGAILATCGHSVQAAQSVSLAWDRSTDTSATGYKLYYSEVGGSTTSAIDVGNSTTGSVPGLVETRTYRFYVTAYNSSQVESVPSNLIDYTVPGANTPPTISSIADQTTIQSIATALIPFTVGDAQTAAGSLTLSATSSNPGLVPVANILFGGSGASRTVKVTPALNQIGTANITVTVSDGSASATESFLLTVNPAGTFTPVFLNVEAESGILASPMAITADQSASQGQRVEAGGDEAGSLTFAVDIPVAGDYVLWCRVLAPGTSGDSFYVSADGGAEDIYDVAQNGLLNAWQWTPVNGRGGTNVAYSAVSALDPRTFQLGVGRHNIVFRGREAGAALDQILITNDRSFAPEVVSFRISTPNVAVSSIVLDPAGFVTVSWPSTPGRTYRVVYKTGFGDATWKALGPDVSATSTTSTRDDYVVGNRFYGVIELP